METEKCPCGSGAEFGLCCGAILSGKRAASTAEELMRSRYAAYAKQDVAYLVKTNHPDTRTPELAAEIQSWMEQVVSWLGLNVLSVSSGTADDKKGKVEFVAEYWVGAGLGKHHELSRFKKYKGAWHYVDAEFIGE